MSWATKQKYITTYSDADSARNLLRCLNLFEFEQYEFPAPKGFTNIAKLFTSKLDPD